MNPTDKKAETPVKAKMQAAMSGLGHSQTKSQPGATPKSGSHVSPNASGSNAPDQGKATGAPKSQSEHHMRIHDLRGSGNSTGFVVTHHKEKDGEPHEIHAIEDVRGLRKHLADHYGEDAMTSDADQQTPAPKDAEKASPADRVEKKGAVSE
jgi:hypothetical protein